MQNILWQIVNKNLNLNLNNSNIEASKPFIAAKGSMPLLHKTIKPTSAKHMVDNHNELPSIKKLKTFHISSAMKRKK